ncbi:MAG: tRNA uridine-5-carboxymethylaminomethyl(34) synthesis enzyme MnmG [Eubacteriales bacterium]|nr:tRNA uridine-5-carboxymethylaminomethyl(34) synthesis enzyme MnmG [Eubacteriales bacterium]
MQEYDAIVVGAGHAGIEAGLALARMGHKTVIMTISLDNIGFLACNPSIGGTAKGHLVREIDALGGEMAIAADKTLLQIKMLNTGKGPAVQSLRGQADKVLYHQYMKRVLEEEKNLDLVQQEATELIVKDGKIAGVKTAMGIEYGAKTVVVCSGVYLNARIIIGEYVKDEGPSGFARATGLTQSFIDNGIEIRRFKTGTPARLDKNSIDFTKMVRQDGDENISAFSFMTKEKLVNKEPCYLTYTNPKTHEVIVKNLDRSPIYNGEITGVGPRYCPSIETKVMRFRDKQRHQIFIEPESSTTNEMYAQGLSSSLPYDVQEEMYHTIDGLEHCKFLRYAYAIEYDCLNPMELLPSLMTKKIAGLFTAGQINGSSGYEEAAAQGLIAGINASLYLRGQEPLVLRRDQAYIGVLIDDLVTKGTEEPYRMMTSRAEYRLFLRQDNADLRLTQIGYDIGLATKERLDNTLEKKAQVEKIIELANKTVSPKTVNGLLEEKGETMVKSGIMIKDLFKRTAVKYTDIVDLFSEFAEFREDALIEAETELKYEGYLQKQLAQIKETAKLENKKLPENINYFAMNGLRVEARQKLDMIRPLNLGQASRISGVSPADINVLIVYLQKTKQ